MPATTTSHVYMCVTFVLEQYCISNSTSKYHIYAYHSMFNFQYLNYVVHNSPLANQVSVPVSFWHPPELQHIYPIGCKLLTVAIECVVATVQFYGCCELIDGLCEISIISFDSGRFLR